MLLDDLMASRERGHKEAVPPPVLTVEPMAVPPTGEVGRRAVRQRLLELEDVARRNLRSAEEARRVLADEHRRLEEESSARDDAEREASALRRELERLRESEEQRDAQAKSRAGVEARAEMTREIERAQQERDQLAHELDSLRGMMSEHDGLLGEYVSRLREEQAAKGQLAAELERAHAAQELAERGLSHASEDARRRSEDDVIRLATVESALADAISDRDRLAARLESATADGETRARDQEIMRLRAQVGELEVRAEEAEERAREAERIQGRMRREASELAKARRTTEAATEMRTAEVDELRARLTEAEAEVVRARADGDRLRAHAAALGDELAAVRAAAPVLQSAASAPFADEPGGEDAMAASADEAPPLERRRPSAPAAPAGVRRHAMAELTAIAATQGDDDFAFRRR
jgi:chromosome segregation ATPase